MTADRQSVAQTVIRPRTVTIITIGTLYGAMIAALCYLFVSTALAHPERTPPLFVELIFAGFFGYCAFSIAFMLSVRAILSESSITRVSFLGAKSFPYSRITSAVIGHGPRAMSPPVLILRAARDRISFFGFGLSFQQLKQIQDAIVRRCAAQSITVQTVQPPIPQKAVPALALGYLLLIVILFGCLIGLGIERNRHPHMLQEQSLSR